MTGMLVLVVLLGAGALVVVGVVLHRDLAQIGEQLERSGHQADFHQQLERFWTDVQGLLADHSATYDTRVRDIEKAVVQAQNNLGEQRRLVNWMARWVQQWAKTSAGDRP